LTPVFRTMAIFRRRVKNFRKEPLKVKVNRIIYSRWVKLILLALFSYTLFIGGRLFYQGLLNAPYLQIREIKVDGVKRVSREEVLELANVRPGDNILAIDVRGMERKIKNHPWVEGVKVGRHIPERTLWIDIHERTPVAFLNLDSLYMVDDKGNVFKRASLEDAFDMPVISGLSSIEDVKEDKGLILEAIDLIHLLSTGGPSGREATLSVEEVSEIKVDNTYGLTLYTLTEGVRIEIGRGNLPERMERLDRVLREIGGLAGVEAIDLNYDRDVVVKLKTHSSSRNL